MAVQKVFISGKSEALIVCQKCGQAKTIQADAATLRGKTAQIRCKACGNSFQVVFEARGRYRKDTALEGHYFKKSGDGEQFGRMVVYDLSMGGLRFEPLGKASFQVGDVLSVVFQLDDAEKSTVRANVIVKRIGEHDVGVEFAMLDEHMRKLLGFYLMP